jgi:hypothetical protein
VNLHGILKVIGRLDIAYVDEISGWVRTACPFAPFRHAKGTDNKPGFGIKIEDDGVSHYNCLACHSKGVLSTLPMQLAHYRDDQSLIEFGEQIRQEEIFGGELSFGDWEEEPVSQETTHNVTNFPDEKAFYRRFRSVLHYPEAIRYIARRGLSASTAILLRLRYDPSQERVLFPIYDERSGRYAGCSGRSILSERRMRAVEKRLQRHNPDFVYPKIRDYSGLQKDRVLLGPRQIVRRLPEHVHSEHVPTTGIPVFNGIIVCEGLFGYAHLRQLRPGYCIKALLGSALTPGKRELLLRAGKPIYWLTDNDLAGASCLYGVYDKETEEFDHRTGALYQLYGEVAQFVMEWPDNKSDPDELTGCELDEMIRTAELFIKGH